MNLRLANVHEHATYALYACRSLVVLRWKESPTVAAVTASTAAIEELLLRTPTKLVFCALASEGVTPPDGPTRAALQGAIKRIEPRLAGVVNVILATGFSAAAMRGVLTGFNLVLRPPYPVVFVGTIPEGAAALARTWPASDAPAPSEAELAAALHSVARV